jgi:hypothetical protein
MLADRETIEERDLEVQCDEEREALIIPISKSNDREEAILFGAIGLLVMIFGASVRR